MWMSGVFYQDSRSVFGYEIEVRNIELVGDLHDYPITGVEHGIESRFDVRHLWLRCKRQLLI